MKIEVQEARLCDLRGGQPFRVADDQHRTVYMVVGDSEDGRRQAVRLEDGHLTAFRATCPIEPLYGKFVFCYAYPGDQ